MNSDKGSAYRIFILRCWSEPDIPNGNAATWRFSLQEVMPEGRQRGFAHLLDMVAFLDAITKENANKETLSS